jgi:hypothetical protein
MIVPSSCSSMLVPLAGSRGTVDCYVVEVPVMSREGSSNSEKRVTLKAVLRISDHSELHVDSELSCMKLLVLT